ncbi:MAG: nuclease, partial [Marmoricola sp.]|nr:nuclease [Marmoricola sp.]
IAIGLRDGGCAAEDCDWPPGMCHIHHLIEWIKNGNTSVKDGLTLCPRHHTLAHNARYQMKSSKNGKVTFSRRT